MSTEPEVMATSLVPSGSNGAGVGLTSLDDLGLIMPIATPARLRQAFAEKQSLYAAILDEDDYIYTVSYTENGKPKQNIYSRRADAVKAADAYRVSFRGSPKKSGIVKLAAALGIESKRKVSGGLPMDPGADYSYVMYEAVHKRTGRSEEGVGWCDTTEKGGRISRHDIIATADTRAYNRAVLRLAGFGDVSADEIIAGASDGAVTDGAVSAPEPSAKKPLALPAPASDEILVAQRAWAEEASKRAAGLLPEAQQNTMAAREMRARARRGNESTARSMGSLGFTWQGPAQDSVGHETFEVEAPSVTIADVERVRAAAAEASKPAAEPDKPPGWNLSGTGNAHEENRTNEKPVTRAQAAAEVPAAGVAKTVSSSRSDANSETITNAQAKTLSEKLLTKLGTRDLAQAWLKKHADVERSSLVRQNQYENLMKLLTKEN